MACEQRAEFDDRNRFLCATLGLLSVASRVERLYERHGAAVARDDAAASEEVPPVLYALMGILSLATRIRRSLDETVPCSVPATPEHRARGAGCSPRDLLA